MKNTAIFSVALVAALCSMAEAFNLSGTVSDKDGQAIQGAAVALLKQDMATVTDEKGSFSFQGTDGTDGIVSANQAAGHFSLNNSVLSFTQGTSEPIQVKLFDMMGNQVYSRTLFGGGSLDLSSTVDAQGSYLAKIKLGSAQETFRFSAYGSYSGSVADRQTKGLAKIAEQEETLQVTADGYDSLSVSLANLDTTLALTLTKTYTEQTYAFGYALKNAPRPSKGCGVNSSLQEVGSNSNAKKYSMTSAGLTREYWVTLPKNYDNTKPYKILFAMHCMGSNAEDFTNHTPDQDHPSPYYGQQALDTNSEFIYVAPRGDTDGMPWRTGDNKDHIFFDELLTLLEENYCIDTSRVFMTGFSFGSMVTNSIAQVFQHRIRAVAVYAVADFNIYIPENAGKPIAWMDVHGVQDNLCTYSKVDSAIDRILKNNGPDGSDARGEQSTRYSGGNTHVCYDYKNVDPRFPVKLCTWGGSHQWTAYDNGNWQNTWVPETVHQFFAQF